MLEARHVNVHYGDTWAVQDVSFDLLEGQWMMLAGPNGAGKSTLIRAIAQTVPWEGSLRLDGENLREMKSMKRARLIGVLAQHNRAQYGYTVEEIVRLGRYAYRQGFLKGGGEDTEQVVEEALRLTGMLDMREKSILNLSGGELQRVKLADSLDETGQIFVIDEPTDGLHLDDIRKLMELFNRMTDNGNTLIIIEHSLDVMKEADYIVEMGPGGGIHGGNLLFAGTPEEMLRSEKSVTAPYLRDSLVEKLG